MNQKPEAITQSFLLLVVSNDLHSVMNFLKLGTDVHVENDRALKLSAECGRVDMVIW